MKRFVYLSILILVLNGSFLFSPKPTAETNFWGEYIPLGKHIGFIRNEDANEFMESAISPTALLRENYVRQNRPLYVMVASAVGYSIYFLSKIFDDIYVLGLEKSIYIAYICLNFIILILALYLFEKLAMDLTKGRIPYTVIVMLSVFIASNFMTKAFFWTAHQQMLAFLMPLLSIYISIYFIENRSDRWLYILFGLLGIGMLVYGSFLILFVVCMMYLSYTLHVKNKLITLGTLYFFVAVLFLFVVPTLLWIFILKCNSVEYYNHEVVRYRQIVWILDALRISFYECILELYENSLNFLKTIHKLHLFFVLFIVVLINQKIKSGGAFLWNKNTMLIVLNLICFSSFFMLLGYYAPRLTFTVMPIILCLTVANLGTMLNDKKSQLVLLAIVCFWHAYNVLSYGPFS